MIEFIIENKDKVAFKDMWNDDKLTIMNALIADYSDVDCLNPDGTWWTKMDASIYTGTCYRVRAKATPLDIPWKYIDKKWDWAAMDRCGKVFLYDERPQQILCTGEWVSDSRCISVGMMCINTEGINWKLSLIKRPE